MKIDLNSDLGESFGRYTLGQDSVVIPLITAANIACGFHAGDPDVMAATVARAEQSQIAVGAHPGFPDLQGFGRRAMQLTPASVQHLVTYQIGALAAFTKSGKLHHVKPHGALYNAAAKDADLAMAVCRGIQDFDSELPIYGLANSELIKAAQKIGLPYAQEVFADRNYQADGSLVPRSNAEAVLKDPQMVAQRAVKMVQEEQVTAINGEIVPIVPDSICVHGDNAAAVKIVQALRQALSAANIKIQAF